MNVLVCGSGGFIGRHVARQLRANGHTVREGRAAEMDFGRDLEVSTWLPRLEGLDAVINAVGVLRDSRVRPMNAVHNLAPEALFRACAQRGLRRVIHISALGIEGNPTLYARSKLQAEAVLGELQEEGCLVASILRPSVVFGREGASSQLFMRLARLPVLLLPGAALRAKIQPVAVKDLAEACVALLRTDSPKRLDCVGARRLTLAEFVASLRSQLGFTPAKVLPLPAWLSRASARCGDFLSFQPWCTETLALLQQDNVGDAGPFGSLLQRPAVLPQNLVATSWTA
jgi:uncharacterized protein YbjT (DUF2867 family)